MAKEAMTFISWLVPARSNIQGELLRLNVICSRVSSILNAENRANWEMAGFLLGVAFSLWRAVFWLERSLRMNRTGRWQGVS
jgi:hypothetical protein